MVVVQMLVVNLQQLVGIRAWNRVERCIRHQRIAIFVVIEKARNVIAIQDR